MLDPVLIQRIRAIFLHREPRVTVAAAADILGWSRAEMDATIRDGEIEVVETCTGGDGVARPAGWVNAERSERGRPRRQVRGRPGGAGLGTLVLIRRGSLTVTLAPAAGGTSLTWTQAFESADVARNVEHIVVPANEQNLDRLSAEVARQSSGG